jgi:hypothetical protein
MTNRLSLSRRLLTQFCGLGDAKEQHALQVYCSGLDLLDAAIERVLKRYAKSS